jgi:hypothetical protein
VVKAHRSINGHEGCPLRSEKCHSFSVSGAAVWQRVWPREQVLAPRGSGDHIMCWAPTLGPLSSGAALLTH